MRPTLIPWEEGGQQLAPTVDAYPQEGIRGGGSAPIHSSPLTKGPWEEGAADCPRLGVDLRTMDGGSRRRVGNEFDCSEFDEGATAGWKGELKCKMSKSSS